MSCSRGIVLTRTGFLAMTSIVIIGGFVLGTVTPAAPRSPLPPTFLGVFAGPRRVPRPRSCLGGCLVGERETLSLHLSLRLRVCLKLCRHLRQLHLERSVAHGGDVEDINVSGDLSTFGVAGEATDNGESLGPPVRRLRGDLLDLLVGGAVGEPLVEEFTEGFTRVRSEVGDLSEAGHAYAFTLRCGGGFVGRLAGAAPLGARLSRR